MIRLDECCQEHDKCFDYIPKGETKYGLENTMRFTMSHYSCDETFIKCLNKINNYQLLTFPKFIC